MNALRCYPVISLLIFSKLPSLKGDTSSFIYTSVVFNNCRKQVLWQRLCDAQSIVSSWDSANSSSVMLQAGCRVCVCVRAKQWLNTDPALRILGVGRWDPWLMVWISADNNVSGQDSPEIILWNHFALSQRGQVGRAPKLRWSVLRKCQH